MPSVAFVLDRPTVNNVIKRSTDQLNATFSDLLIVFHADFLRNKTFPEKWHRFLRSDADEHHQLHPEPHQYFIQTPQ